MGSFRKLRSSTSGTLVWLCGAFHPSFLLSLAATLRGRTRTVVVNELAYVFGLSYDSILQEIFHSDEATAQNDPERSQATVSRDASSSSVRPWIVTEFLSCVIVMALGAGPVVVQC